MKLKEFSSRKTTVKCYECKQERHYARKCPNLYCTNCKMKGHSLEKCRKRDNAKSCVQSASGNEPDHVSYAFRAGGTIHKDMGLLVDTGASSHIVRDPAMFSSFNDKFNTQRHSIELADRTQSKAAKERGTAHIAIMDANGRTHNATLNNATSTQISSFLITFIEVRKNTWGQVVSTVISISIGLQEVPTQGTTKMIGAHLCFSSSSILAIIITLILVTLYLYETI